METKMIGSKIAEARKKINFSQAQLAERLFISPQAVGKWERGESFPDIITFNRLSKILGVDLNYFSEDFKFAGNEAVNEPSITPVTESLSKKQKKKSGWDMSRGNWVDADFSGLKNLHEKFSASNMQRCQFIDSDMAGLLLKSNHIESCDFRGSNLSNSLIHNSYLANNLLNDCLLTEAEILGSHIRSCNFTGSDFTGTVFKSCAFENNTMTHAVLNNTSFNTTDLANLVFDSTLENCYFENCSFFKVTFQNATLINTFFKNRKLKGIHFVDCKADRMTYEFLKNDKADLSGITLFTL